MPSVSHKGRSNTYLEHFGLRELPFTLTPNPDFFIDLPAFHKAAELVRQALQSGEAIIKITGEAGTGKTLLCQRLVHTLGPDYFCAWIPNAFLSPDGLLLALAGELELPVTPALGRHHILGRVHERLLALHAAGQKPVLLLDEAQALPEESVEALRLLTNLEAGNERLLQVVLLGQPELNDLLNRDLRRLLLQRVTSACVLPPLQPQEVGQYINFRLNRAGCSTVNLFGAAALDKLYRASGGIPLLLNRLCHEALLTAWQAGAAAPGPAHIVRASEHIEELASGSHYFRSRVSRSASHAVLALACLAASGLTLVGVYIF